MGFLSKITDPLGVKKKLKKKAKKELKGTFLGDVIEFEDFQMKRWEDMLKDNPEQALLGGLTPVGSKLWSKATGKDYEPFVNMLGGPTQQAYADAEAAGIDTSDVQTSHKIAEMVASWYAGGALSNLAGQGAAATGSKLAGRAASAITPKVGSAIVTTGAGALEEAARPVGPAPWDPGPGEYLAPLVSTGRQFLGVQNPYRYGFGPGQVMVGGLGQATGGG